MSLSSLWQTSTMGRWENDRKRSPWQKCQSVNLMETEKNSLRGTFASTFAASCSTFFWKDPASAKRHVETYEAMIHVHHPIGAVGRVGMPYALWFGCFVRLCCTERWLRMPLWNLTHKVTKQRLDVFRTLWCARLSWIIHIPKIASLLCCFVFVYWFWIALQKLHEHCICSCLAQLTAQLWKGLARQGKWKLCFWLRLYHHVVDPFVFYSVLLWLSASIKRLGNGDRCTHLGLRMSLKLGKVLAKCEPCHELNANGTLKLGQRNGSGYCGQRCLGPRQTQRLLKHPLLHISVLVSIQDPQESDGDKITYRVNLPGSFDPVDPKQPSTSIWSQRTH